MTVYNYALTDATLPGKIYAAETPSTATWHTLNFNCGGGVKSTRTITIIPSTEISISNDSSGTTSYLIPAKTPFDIELGGLSRNTYYVNGAAAYTLYVSVSR